MAKAVPATQAAAVHLLDGNVLVALVSSGHVHHAAAQRWFASHAHPFATCPITQGTLVRLSMHLGMWRPTWSFSCWPPWSRTRATASGPTAWGMTIFRGAGWWGTGS